MKKVRFVKPHPAGIAEGHIATVADQHADRWISQGYAEEVTEDTPAASLAEAPEAPTPTAKAKKGGKAERKDAE